MPVQAAPGAALEVIEPELLFQLLMRLLADPTCLDEGGELLQRRVGRQVREIVFALTRAAMLTPQPDLVAGQMLAGPALQAHLRPIGDPHPHGRELRPQRTLGAAP